MSPDWSARWHLHILSFQSWLDFYTLSKWLVLKFLKKKYSWSFLESVCPQPIRVPLCTTCPWSPASCQLSSVPCRLRRGTRYQGRSSSRSEEWVGQFVLSACQSFQGGIRDSCLNAKGWSDFLWMHLNSWVKHPCFQKDKHSSCFQKSSNLFPCFWRNRVTWTLARMKQSILFSGVFT